MVFSIKNKHISVTASTVGAELQAVTGNDGTGYLWQGDPEIWKDRAPNLFPYIARLTNGEYSLKGKIYLLPIHGFAHTSEFEIVTKTETKMTFCLKSDSRTRAIYPFEFSLWITYEIADNMLTQTYTVANRSGDTMYFGIGAHPGFKVPLDDAEEFEDYYLDFGVPSAPIRMGFSDDCFVNGCDIPYPLSDGKKIPLSHGLFDNDAIVLKDMPDSVMLRSRKSDHSICIRYPDMKYLGLWHAPHTKARYICIEPWSSLPSRKGLVEDLERQDNLLSLAAGKIFETSIVFEFA